ncbi:MAG: class I SAM-dependent methyltransferase [Chloroflexota bacterium]
MDQYQNLNQPPSLEAIQQDTLALGFTMASDPLTGSLLRTLAASKRASRFLELGTGTGLSTAWILDGMDGESTLLTVDNDSALTAIAQKHLADDVRLTIHTMDGIALLESLQGEQFDFIFADTWPGKFDRLDLALNLVKIGGFYIVDDMLPQPNWPPEHLAKVMALLDTFDHLENFRVTKMAWASGLVLLVRTA